MSDSVGLKRGFSRAARFVFWLLAVPTVVVAVFALYVGLFLGIVYTLGENVVLYGLLASCAIGGIGGLIGFAWDLSGESR